jgi:hypothetical protein
MTTRLGNFSPKAGSYILSVGMVQLSYLIPAAARPSTPAEIFSTLMNERNYYRHLVQLLDSGFSIVLVYTTTHLCEHDSSADDTIRVMSRFRPAPISDEKIDKLLLLKDSQC